FCAAPYVHRLLDFDAETSAAHEAEVLRGHAGIKLAFARLSFNYFMSETVFEYLVDAVHFMADHGWKLMPFYRFDPATGLWQHRDGPRRPRVSLDDFSVGGGAAQRSRRRATAPESVLPRYLTEARRIVAEVEAYPPVVEPSRPVSAEFERLRWFPLPHEAAAALSAAGAGRTAS
ncbi:MAG TPA: hypothetical protein VNO56_03180, partial [Gaiellaceae bacterium]|nr:hypothetical protein [Gaiellaceae bacterium]